MNKEELIRKLKSMGATIFVQYFDVFKSYAEGRISKEDCIEVLVSEEVSNENGASIRCSNAKSIFQANMGCQAIGIICEKWQGTRLSEDTIETAMHILQDCP